MSHSLRYRSLEVANPQAIPAGAQRTNAELIADNLGDRASVQLTWVLWAPSGVLRRFFWRPSGRPFFQAPRMKCSR